MKVFEFDNIIAPGKYNLVIQPFRHMHASYAL